MSDPTFSTPAPAPAATPPADLHPHSLIVRIWPNVPILYPMAIAALLCGIFSMMFGVDSTLKRISTIQPAITKQVDAVTQTVAAEDVQVSVKPADVAAQLRAEQVIALVFLAVFTYALIVVCTDIVLTWALLGLAIVVIAALLLFIGNIYYHFLPGLFDFIGRFTPVANAQFYFAIFIIWGVLMIGGILYSRVHYVKIESNEVVLVGGIMEKRKRYSSMRMQYTKEIIDVFEYCLPFVRSGRLILRFPQEAEPVIIDHVMHIDRIIAKLDHVTATLQVTPEDREEATA